MQKFNAKLVKSTSKENNQKNMKWWNDNPMIYDWDGDLGDPQMTKEYFQKIDQLFGESHSLCNNENWPAGYVLEKFIPYHQLNGKDVLEIGCGAGLVSSHLSKCGAKLTAIDLTENAVLITKKRFELEDINANILRMDAEKLEINDDSFDYIISWGVIHHSGDMQSIISEINRILRPGGKAYIMVYNKNSLRYKVYCRFWLGIVRMRYLRQNLEEIAGSITDGYIARHLTEKEINKLTRNFSSTEFSYSDEVITISYYMLGPFRRLFKPFPNIIHKIEKWLAVRWGWYMQIVLTK